MRIDQFSEVPPFEQIKAQIAAGRASGDFPAGHRLPPVRHLAAELGLAPNTVARAYRELEASGVIETRGRQGSFVTGTVESSSKVVAAAAQEFAGLVRRLNVPDAQALALIRAALGTS